MNKQDPIDEVFGFNTPKEVDTTKIMRYFKDLERSINKADKDLEYYDEEDVKEAIGEISNELSWVGGDIYELMESYDNVQGLIAAYRSLLEDRMTEEELYELNTIRVQNKLESTK